MKKLLLHFYLRNQIYDSEKETTKVSKKICSQGKSSDPPGSFGFKRTGKINFGTLQKISKKFVYS